MQPQPPLHPAGPGQLLDVRGVLNGAVDMRTYQHKHLVVFARNEVSLGWNAGPDPNGLLASLTTCVEWLDEHFGFEAVSVFANPIQGTYIYYAMLRRHREV
ncbi:hypothetical protein ACFQZZ_20975 [Nocardia sp. GCM10030253]|uniref:hypothetical protein n=1 Tax=Nocardia sp. GCM10030253 TaxID=3273404 RepID=UPI00363CA2D5